MDEKRSRPEEVESTYIPYLDKSQWAKMNVCYLYPFLTQLFEKKAIHQRDAVLSKLREYETSEKYRKDKLSKAQARAKVAEKAFECLLDTVHLLSLHINASLKHEDRAVNVPTARQLMNQPHTIFGLFSSSVEFGEFDSSIADALIQYERDLHLLCDGIRFHCGVDLTESLTAMLIESKEACTMAHDATRAEVEVSGLRAEVASLTDQLALVTQAGDMHRREKIALTNQLAMFSQAQAKEKAEGHRQSAAGTQGKTATPETKTGPAADEVRELRLKVAALETQASMAAARAQQAVKEKNDMSDLLNSQIRSEGGSDPTPSDAERQAWEAEKAAMQAQIDALQGLKTQPVAATEIKPPAHDEVVRLRAALDAAGVGVGVGQPHDPTPNPDRDEELASALAANERLATELKEQAARLHDWATGHEGDDADVWGDLAAEADVVATARDAALADCVSLRARNAGLVQQVMGLRDGHLGLKRSVEAREQELAATRARLDKVHAEYETYKAAITKLEGERTALGRDVVRERAAVARREGDIASRDASIARLEGALAGIRGQLDTLKALQTKDATEAQASDAAAAAAEEHVQVLKAQNLELTRILTQETGADGPGLHRLVLKYEAFSKCPSCRMNIRNTRLAKCNHTFCKTCIDALIQKRDRKCPFCKKKFDDQRDVDHFLLQE